jgi:hypothetical protein
MKSRVSWSGWGKILRVFECAECTLASLSLSTTNQGCTDRGVLLPRWNRRRSPPPTSAPKGASTISRALSERSPSVERPPSPSADTSIIRPRDCKRRKRRPDIDAKGNRKCSGGEWVGSRLWSHRDAQSPLLRWRRDGNHGSKVRISLCLHLHTWNIVAAADKGPEDQTAGRQRVSRRGCTRRWIVHDQPSCHRPVTQTRARQCHILHHADESTSVSASRGLQGLTKRMRVMRRVVSSGCQPVGVNGRVCGVYCHILLVQARRFKNHVSGAEPISCCKLALL